MRRDEIFSRDNGRCVYCGLVFDPSDLTIDHVQARVRHGDRSAGNLVTACHACNRRKGHQRLAEFLVSDADARRNFFRYATAVWPRHLRAVRQELAAAGIAVPSPNDDDKQ